MTELESAYFNGYSKGGMQAYSDIFNETHRTIEDIIKMSINEANLYIENNDEKYYKRFIEGYKYGYEEEIEEAIIKMKYQRCVTDFNGWDGEGSFDV